MSLKEIIIKVENRCIKLNPKLSIPIESTNIPVNYMTFNANNEHLWRVGITQFDKDSKCLSLKVLDFDSKDLEVFNAQTPKSEIRLIAFEPMKWVDLQKCLSSYQKSQLSHFIIDDEIVVNTDEDEENYVSPYGNFIDPTIAFQTKILNQKFWINFSDARFCLGYVSFKRYIDELEREVDLKIHNPNILPEFELIKFWFSKKLKTVKFEVKASLTVRSNEIIKTGISSRQIDLITSDLIESIKYQRTSDIIKTPKFDIPDKELFSPDEIFNQFSNEDQQGNIFNQSEEDILNFLLERLEVRNKKQLIYLSGKKQSDGHKLKFTLSPNFGFLFFVEGEKNNHFIWELLNSHATYIWSIDKMNESIQLQYSRIENAINSIRTHGRKQYKLSHINNHLDEDLVFKVIDHQSIGSDLVDGFPRWKAKLNEQLI